MITYRTISRYGALFLLVALASCTSRAGVPDSISAEAILTLKPGMAYGELTAVIGNPLMMQVEIANRPGVWRQTRDPLNGSVWLSYSRRPWFAERYPMISVFLTEGRVKQIQVREYDAFGFNHSGVYGYAAGGAAWVHETEFRQLLAR